MGFSARSVSMVRYRIRGEIQGSFWEAVDEGIRRYAFREVEGPGDQVGMGWTSIDDFTDNEFQGASYVRGSYVALSLRVDTARVPPRILEIHYKQEAVKMLEQTGQQRLSSGQRRELKEQLKESLKRKMLPAIQVFDLVWDTARAVVYFGSLGVKARERVEELFKKSFGLTLIPLIPYLRAEEILADASERGVLEKLTPSSLAP
jgi:DNA recombination-dependent growth factor C